MKLIDFVKQINQIALEHPDWEVIYQEDVEGDYFKKITKITEGHCDSEMRFDDGTWFDEEKEPINNAICINFGEIGK